MQLEMNLGEDHPILKPSQFWQEWNLRNAEQLVEFGFQNFKQHQALNYFTWMPHDRSVRDQFTFLRSRLSLLEQLRALPFYPSWLRPWWQVGWRMPMRIRYCALVRLLWQYAERFGDAQVLALGEPWMGNPLRVDRSGRVSQDLANTSLEVASIVEGWNQVGDQAGPTRILELGAGYGRTAWGLIGRYPRARYVIVDFPPALLLSETYLSRMLPNKKVFKARKWTDFSEVKEELEAADIAFLLPSQALKLPDHFVQLFLTISSLGEMRMDQIRLYLELASRITTHLFYFKQWKVSVNKPDAIVINEDDYPIAAHWRRLFQRTAPVQTQFFEAAYATK
jgi:hypothetical protein